MEAEKSPKRHIDQKEEEYPPRKLVFPAMAALYLTVFLIALDRTILGTAVPQITDEFNSFGDISWYEAGFLLPLCMLQLSFGLVYTFYSAKWILTALVIVFETGSIVCATAPSSKALIVGRVITGIGGAGITSGALILINILVPLNSRPKYSGGIGAMFGLASIIGPLVGGYLTAITWRWCFWINVPIGGVAVLVLIFLCPNRPPPAIAAPTLLGKVKQLDPIGFCLIAPAIVCLLFALQWGGQKYAWSDGRIIALFVVAGFLCLAFLTSQVWQAGQGTIPSRITSQRTMIAASVASIGIGSIMVVYSFYIPVWFQAIQGKLPQSAGLSLLPLLLSQVVFVIFGGVATTVSGFYTPFLIIGGAISIIGSGLITTWEVHTGAGKWISYQIVAGTGFGLTLQQPNIAAQTVLSKSDAPIGLSILTFLQFLGGTIFVTVCQTLLQTKLVQGLDGKVKLDASAISNGGATTLRNEVSKDQLEFVLKVYNDSLTSVWYLTFGLSCLIFLASFGFEWKSVKKTEKKEEGQNVEV
ncbi:hypothetical protein N7510_009835 [Penicillium lagena]|uniref:uncharacterized protein n=1 Tax=Penicillium lagena TaxID=94218 RepID=UPI00253F684C|nr:uncharacterized protein N7510_009835 [Penicillium lagena]KAJ5604681.1 hypothetical protein N7510_009835 [Penicillium lagena]